MKKRLIEYYLQRIKSTAGTTCIIYSSRPAVFVSLTRKKVLKELQDESTTKESTEEKEKFEQSKNRSIDSYAVDEAVRRNRMKEDIVTVYHAVKDVLQTSTRGGHYIPRRHRATELEKDNIFPQCPRCNGFDEGNSIG